LLPSTYPALSAANRRASLTARRRIALKRAAEVAQNASKDNTKSVEYSMKSDADNTNKSKHNDIFTLLNSDSRLHRDEIRADERNLANGARAAVSFRNHAT
jgi:hypothetical protein